MAAATATPVPATPTSQSKVPVRIFEAGSYDGEEYTTEFLDEVVANFRQYQSSDNPIGYPQPQLIDIDGAANSGVILPDIGIGHDQDQAFLKKLLDRTDLPSAGRPEKLYRSGSFLYATFKGVPEKIAAMMNGGQYSHCSSEFYRNYTDDQGQQYGPMLRRVSLLGGEIPRVKSLGRLPQMVYSEPPGHGQRLVCFSELRKMNDETLQQLAACGVNTATLVDANVPDEVLKEFLRALQAAKGGPIPPPDVTAGEGDPDDPAKATNPAPAFAEGDDPNKPAQFSEKRVKAMIDGAVKAAVAQATAGVRPALAKLDAAAKHKERQDVAAFCERMQREWKVKPSEMETTDEKGKPKPNLVDYILSMDNQAIVVFGEKKLSPRSAFMAEIEARAQFSERGRERMADPILPGSGGGGKMTAERRAELLGYTHVGRAILQKEKKAA